MAHVAANVRVPEGPVIGVMTCKMVNGVLWLFDADGRRLDEVQSIQVNQSVDAVTTATVVLVINMHDGDNQDGE